MTCEGKYTHYISLTMPLYLVVGIAVHGCFNNHCIDLGTAALFCLAPYRGVGRDEIVVGHFISPCLRIGGAICHQPTKKCSKAPPIPTPLSFYRD